MGWLRKVGGDPGGSCPCWTASLLTELTPPDLANADNNFPNACDGPPSPLIENWDGGFQIYAYFFGGGQSVCAVGKWGSFSDIALPEGSQEGLTDAQIASCQYHLIAHAQSYARPGVWDCFSN